MTTRTRRGIIALFGLVALVMLVQKILDVRADRHLQSVAAELTRKYGSLYPGILNLPKVPADENRAAYLRAATDLVVFESDTWKWIPRAYGETRLNTLDTHRSALQALLARNTLPLELARKSRGLSKSNWDIQYASGIHADSPPYQRINHLSSLLHAGGLVELKENRPEAALDWIETGLALAGSLRGEARTSPLWGPVFDMAPISALREVLIKSEPSAAALASVQRAIEVECTGVPASRVIFAEIVMIHDRFREFESGNSGWLPVGFGRFLFSSLADWRPFRWVVHPLIVELHALALERAETASRFADTPWYGRHGDPLKTFDEEKVPGWVRWLDSSFLQSSWMISIDNGYLNRTRVGVALASVALRRYRIDHGAYPDRLEALCPAYLKEIPIDLLTGEPVAYKRLGEGFELRGTPAPRDGEASQRKKYDRVLTWTIPR